MKKVIDVCCIVWKDKNAVVLLSIHAKALSALGVQQFVYKKINKKKKKVRSGLITYNTQRI